MIIKLKEYSIRILKRGYKYQIWKPMNVRGLIHGSHVTTVHWNGEKSFAYTTASKGFYRKSFTCASLK